MESCGGLTIRVHWGPVDTGCMEPVSTTQCSHYGNGVAVFGREVVCLRGPCDPTCHAVARTGADRAA